MSDLSRKIAQRVFLASRAVVTLPKGSVLFHGTLEKFGGPLRPGGDELAWFADTPAVAQLYIPRSGLSIYTGPRNLVRPSRDTDIQMIQKAVGIVYDLTEVEWGSNGRAESYYFPAGWDGLPDPNEIAKRLNALGYKDIKSPFDYTEFRIADDDTLMLPGEAAQGFLYIATTMRDMKLWNKATGESDLLDLQYNDIRGFRDAEKAGLDGVLIDDFAQSEERGNLGHSSVGLFKNALRNIRTKRVPAQYREFEHGQHGTPEWPNAKPPWVHRLI